MMLAPILAVASRAEIIDAAADRRNPEMDAGGVDGIDEKVFE